MIKWSGRECDSPEPDMQCTQCGARNEAGSKFCADCGAMLAVAATRVPYVDVPATCPACGQPTEHSERFCKWCGSAIGRSRIQAQAVSAATAPTTLSCPRCGAPGTPGGLFCEECGAPVTPVHSAPIPELIAQSRESSGTTSAAWWLLPITMAWIGGLVAYLVVKDSDERKAKRLVIGGLAVTALWIVASIVLAAISSAYEW